MEKCQYCTNPVLLWLGHDNDLGLCGKCLVDYEGYSTSQVRQLEKEVEESTISLLSNEVKTI